MFTLVQGINHLKILRDLLRDCILEPIVLLRFTDDLTKIEKFCIGIFTPPINNGFNSIEIDFYLVNIVPASPNEINLLLDLSPNQIGKGNFILEIYNAASYTIGSNPIWADYVLIYKDYAFNSFPTSN
jgi:hypothetical protein